MKTKEEKTQEAFDMLTGFLDPHGFTELCDEFYDVVAEAMQEYASHRQQQIEDKIRGMIDKEKVVFDLMNRAGDAGIVDRKIHDAKIEILQKLLNEIKEL